MVSGRSEKKVGNRRKNLFWEEIWIGEVKLQEHFKRLFDLSLQKRCRGGGTVENGSGIGDEALEIENLCCLMSYLMFSTSAR